MEIDLQIERIIDIQDIREINQLTEEKIGDIWEDRLSKRDKGRQGRYQLEKKNIDRWVDRRRKRDKRQKGTNLYRLGR